MIFLSHTHADKPIVETLAQPLGQIFGADKVFYDSWSIQPGDGVIDKMNDALAQCRHFFFFVSKKSLQSNMVKLEWQNAVLKATKGETKIIPVKLDDCMMPAILLQTLYIDLFGQGPEVALRQMVDVIAGRNVYCPDGGGYQNLRAYMSTDGSKVTIEFRAETYMEPHSRYLVLLENPESEVAWSAPREGMFESRFAEKAVTLGDGRVVSGLLMARQTPTTPGFPLVAELTPRTGAPIRVVGAMRIVAHDKFTDVPLIPN